MSYEGFRRDLELDMRTRINIRVWLDSDRLDRTCLLDGARAAKLLLVDEEDAAALVKNDQVVGDGVLQEGSGVG